MLERENKISLGKFGEVLESLVGVKGFSWDNRVCLDAKILPQGPRGTFYFCDHHYGQRVVTTISNTDVYGKQGVLERFRPFESEPLALLNEIIQTLNPRFKGSLLQMLSTSGTSYLKLRELVNQDLGECATTAIVTKILLEHHLPSNPSYLMRGVCGMERHLFVIAKLGERDFYVVDPAMQFEMQKIIAVTEDRRLYCVHVQDSGYKYRFGDSERCKIKIER